MADISPATRLALRTQLGKGGGSEVINSLEMTTSSTKFTITDAAYGAIGDGVTDDTASIAAAVAAAEAITAVGGKATVVIPRGTYVSSQITLSGSRVTIEGEGKILRKPGASNDQLLNLTGDFNVIRGIEFDGNVNSAIAMTGRNEIIKITGNNNLVEDLWCHHNYDVGNDTGDGIKIAGIGNTALKCTINNIIEDGISCLGVGIKVIDCYVKDIGDEGIFIGGFVGAATAYSTVIQGCRLDGEAVLVDPGKQVFSPNTLPMENVVIRDCWISSPGIPMKLTRARNILVEGCDITTTTNGSGNNIRIGEGIERLTFRNCNIKTQLNFDQVQVDFKGTGAGTWSWLASGADATNFYLVQGAGDTIEKPSWGAEDISATVTAFSREGKPGELLSGEWGWGDDDALGYKTIYVHLDSDVDPDSVLKDELLWFYDPEIVVIEDCIIDTSYNTNNQVSCIHELGGRVLVVRGNLFKNFTTSAITLVSTNSIFDKLELSNNVAYANNTGATKMLAAAGNTNAANLTGEVLDMEKIVAWGNTIRNYDHDRGFMDYLTGDADRNKSLNYTPGVNGNLLEYRIELTGDVNVDIADPIGGSAYSIPDGAVIKSVQLNLDTLVVASGTSTKVGVGPDGASDPDKYGITSGLTKNLKINTIPAHAVLSGAEKITINACADAGGIGDTNFTSGFATVRIIFDYLHDLNDAL